MLAALAVMGVAIVVAIHNQKPDEKLHIVFCDVGQGDAILLSRGSTQLLIDAGPDDSVVSCLSKYMPFWDRVIEFVVATHADADHIGGMEAVFARYTTELIYIPIARKETSDFAAFEHAVQTEADNGATVVIGARGQSLQIGDEIMGRVIWPHFAPDTQKSTIFGRSETTLSDIFASLLPNESDHNDLSISLIVTFDQVSIALVGDLEKAGEEAVIVSGLIEDVDVLKVGHHGSNTSSYPDFLGNLRPEVSVINSGKNNTFGHPSPGVISRLEEVGALILRTDTSGVIEIVTDGKTITLPSTLD